MDNQEFAAQLATFNSLGQLIDINQKLGTLQNISAASNQFSATTMIGKEITTEANTVSLAGDGSAKIGFQLGSNAARADGEYFQRRRSCGAANRRRRTERR